MKIWPRSLTGRIFLVEGLAVLVVIILLPTLTISLLHQTMRDFEERALTAQAHEVAASVSLRNGAVRVHLPASLAAAYATAYDGRAFTLLDAAGQVVAASKAGRRLPAKATPRRRQPVRFDLPPLTAVSLPVTIAGLQLWVVVSQDQAEPGAILDDVVDAFLWRYIIILVAALILLPLVNSLLTRRLVVAVKRVSRRAAMIGPNSLRVRLDEAGLPLEIVELVHATNDLVARLEESFGAQREFIGNVAHELRTPLATLKVQLDAVPSSDARDTLHRSLDRVSHVVSQLRDLARLETIETGGRRAFDVREIARETVEELAPEVYAAGHTISLDMPDEPVMLIGEPTLTRLAFDNLVGNAIRHTPPGTKISVDVSVGGEISVADDGPGIASETQAMVGQRFWRADQHRSDTAGLGLSIVQRIIDVHGWQLHLISREHRGSVFRIICTQNAEVRYPKIL